MAILKIGLVKSGDGKFRYRVVWTKRKFSYFAHPSELRDLARQLLLLIKDEPNAIKHLGTDRDLGVLGTSETANGSRKARNVVTETAQESPEVKS